MNRRGELMSTSEFETLGLSGNKLPPLLNLDNPSPHLRLDRFESFKSYLTNRVFKQNSGYTVTYSSLLIFTSISLGTSIFGITCCGCLSIGRA